MSDKIDQTPSSYLATMLGSATSGLIARLPCHPLDTVKARLQVQTTSSSAAEYRGVWHALQQISAQEGLRGLYRGFGVTLLAGAPASMLYFTSYELARDSLQNAHPRLKEWSFATHFVAGMVAEAVSCTLWVPIDVIKERMQIQRMAGTTGAPVAGGTYYRNTVHALRSIVATEGVAGVYRGYSATLLSFGPFSALYFLFYEQFKAAAQRALRGGDSQSSKAPLPFWASLGVGAAAGSAAAVVTNPLDLAKLRLQVQRASAASVRADKTAFGYSGVGDALREIVRQEGAAALMRGAGARVAFSAPMTAVSFALFESCKAQYALLLERSE